MAQVPYSPVPDATLQLQATPDVHVNTPEAAFGGDIGRALGTLGQATQQAGGEIYQRAIALQDLNNESDARVAAADYMEKAGVLHADFSSKSGRDAGPEAFQQYTQKLSDLRMKVREGLGNPMAQRLYDADSFSTMGRTIFNGAGHSAEQMKLYALGASKAQGEAALNQIMGAPKDERTYQAGAALNEKAARWRSTANGESPEQIDQAGAIARSDAAAARITGLAWTNPDIAKQLLDKAIEDKTLRGEAIPKLQELVDKNLYTHQSAVIANDQMSKPGTLSERVAAGRAAAAKVTDDPLLADHVESQIVTRDRTNDFVQKQTQITAIDTINDAIEHTKKPLLNLQDLKTISPEVSTAVDALNATGQLRVQKQLEVMAKHDNNPSPARDANFQKLSGLAYSNPSTFLDTDMYGKDLQADRREDLISMQHKLAKGGKLDNPELHVTLTNPVIQQALSDAGINAKDTPDDYHKYAGALAQAINERRSEGKPLSYKDSEDLAKSLLADHVTKGTWWNGSEKIYTTIDRGLPIKDANRIRAALQAKGMPAADINVQQVWFRSLFLQANKPNENTVQPKAPVPATAFHK